MISMQPSRGADQEPDGPGASDVTLLVRSDQFAALRRGMLIAIPVNALIGLVATLIAAQAGRPWEGLTWFAVSTAVNLVRFSLCRLPLSTRLAPAAALDGRMRLVWMTAGLSGIVWAFQPLLSDGYTTPETLFYLVATCGVTAGAVTHGTAFARMPIAFITPPLLSAFGCLVAIGSFDRICLAGTVLLYLVALIRSARQSEAAFCEASRLKFAATAMARSLTEANGRALEGAAQMARRAAHDPLTDVLNRAGFVEAVERRVSAAPFAPRCLILLDLDGFKSINDAFGHATGDRVLVEVARRLRQEGGSEMSIARLGGDEFALFWSPSPLGLTPKEVADRLIAAVGLPFESFDAGRLGASIGIHAAQGVPIAEMLVCADAALYAAKSAGRNRSRVFDDALSAQSEMRRDIERDLPRALAGLELEVWFQPVFGGGGCELSSFEALLRWRHPKHGWLPPPDVIAGAAMAGLSDALLRFILDEACAMLAALREAGLGGIHVAVNVSPREMAQIAVDEIVLARLAELGVSPGLLEIEITEETAMDMAAVRHRLAALRGAGVRLAVDDFGVGFSSLASLRELRPSRVKIDRCFITGIARSVEDQKLVAAILGLGRSLSFDVVAEGVETADDLWMLQAAGCRFVQGYHLGRPMTLTAVLDWLRRRERFAA